MENCYAKGGGKEKDAPEWFKKLPVKKNTSASANVTEKSKMDEGKNYAMFTYSTSKEPTTLIATSDSPAEALTISRTSEMILDSVLVDIFPLTGQTF